MAARPDLQWWLARRVRRRPRLGRHLAVAALVKENGPIQAGHCQERTLTMFLEVAP